MIFSAKPMQMKLLGASQECFFEYLSSNFFRYIIKLFAAPLDQFDSLIHILGFRSVTVVVFALEKVFADLKPDENETELH
jgi:hypothetical protein